MKKTLPLMLAISILTFFSSCENSSYEDTIHYTTSPEITKTTEESTVITSTSSFEATTETLPSMTMEIGYISVSEMIDLSLDVVKISVFADGNISAPEVPGEYIKDLVYEIVLSSNGQYMEFQKLKENELTIYMPLEGYRKLITNNQKILISGITTSGERINEYISPSLNADSYFSDEPMQVSDEFLHFALTNYFEGAYSERDLLNIPRLSVSYCNDARGCGINIDGNWYAYETYFDIEKPTMIPDTLLQDLRYFHAIYKVQLFEQTNERTALLAEYEKATNPYLVTYPAWEDMNEN